MRLVQNAIRCDYLLILTRKGCLSVDLKTEHLTDHSRRARAQRAKRDYELLAVVDATRDDVQFFEARRITTQRAHGMRVYNGDLAIR